MARQRSREVTKLPQLDKGYTIYVHFSFRQPKNEEYGIFACAAFFDKEFTQLITKKAVADKMWYPGDQHLSAIQSYYKALEYIYNNQADMIRNGITNVILVSGNSSLVNWILGRGRNKYYMSFTESICAPFRFNAPKEIVIGVGLMEAVDKEKSKKYCRENLVDNLDALKSKIISTDKKVYAFDISEKADTKKKGTSIVETPKIRTILDIMNESEPKVEEGIVEIQ